MFAQMRTKSIWSYYGGIVKYLKLHKCIESCTSAGCFSKKLIQIKANSKAFFKSEFSPLGDYTALNGSSYLLCYKYQGCCIKCTLLGVYLKPRNSMLEMSWFVTFCRLTPGGHWKQITSALQHPFDLLVQ